MYFYECHSVVVKILEFKPDVAVDPGVSFPLYFLAVLIFASRSDCDGANGKVSFSSAWSYSFLLPGRLVGHRRTRFFG